MRRLVRDPVSIGCALVILLIALAAIFAPWLGLADPYQGSMIRRLRPIGTPGYPLGTDELGRDMLVAADLWRAAVAVHRPVSGVARVRDRHDARRDRRAMSAASSTRSSCAPSTSSTPSRRCCWRSRFPARSAPASSTACSRSPSCSSRRSCASPKASPPACAISTSSMPRAHPAPDALTIMRVHVLGNVLGPIFVYATSLISVCMILAAGLSFLGLGTKPPEPEWGLMLNTLRTAIYVNPWVAALPGVMIFIVSICFNLSERRPAECDGCPKLRRSRRPPMSAGRRSRCCRCRTWSSISTSAAACSAARASCARSTTCRFSVDKGEVRRHSSASPAAASPRPRG